MALSWFIVGHKLQAWYLQWKILQAWRKLQLQPETSVAIKVITYLLAFVILNSYMLYPSNKMIFENLCLVFHGATQYIFVIFY